MLCNLGTNFKFWVYVGVWTVSGSFAVAHFVQNSKEGPFPHSYSSTPSHSTLSVCLSAILFICWSMYICIYRILPFSLVIFFFSKDCVCIHPLRERRMSRVRAGLSAFFPVHSYNMHKQEARIRNYNAVFITSVVLHRLSDNSIPSRWRKHQLRCRQGARRY